MIRDCDTCAHHASPTQARFGLCLSPREQEPGFWIAEECPGYEFMPAQERGRKHAHAEKLIRLRRGGR